MTKPELVGSEVVAQNPWTKIVRDKLVFSGGNQGEYLVVERGVAMMMIVLETTKDGVFTYIVEQYRYPIDQRVWQFPMGTHEEGKSILNHAREELRQETGLVVGHIKQVGQFYVDPGLSRQRCQVFIAESIHTQGKQELEETEQGMTVKRVGIPELNEMAAKGMLSDSWGFAALFFINQHLTSKT